MELKTGIMRGEGMGNTLTGIPFLAGPAWSISTGFFNKINIILFTGLGVEGFLMKTPRGKGVFYTLSLEQAAGLEYEISEGVLVFTESILHYNYDKKTPLIAVGIGGGAGYLF